MLIEQIEKNRRKAVIHLLKIKRIRNPEMITKLEDGIYSHTNARGRTKYYIVAGTFREYDVLSQYVMSQKLHMVMGFYIIETELYSIFDKRKKKQMKLINSYELSQRIFDCVSDGYDDEEYREETESALYNELSQLSNDSYIKSAFLKLCERIEEMEDVIKFYDDELTVRVK